PHRDDRPVLALDAGQRRVRQARVEALGELLARAVVPAALRALGGAGVLALAVLLEAAEHREHGWRGVAEDRGPGAGGEDRTDRDHELGGALHVQASGWRTTGQGDGALGARQE